MTKPDARRQVAVTTLTEFQREVLAVIVGNRLEQNQSPRSRSNPNEKEWIEISCLPEQEIIRPADTQPDTPIGVAIVNEMGEPGWLGNHPDLKIHHGSICACWPGVNVVEEAK